MKQIKYSIRFQDDINKIINSLQYYEECNCLFDSCTVDGACGGRGGTCGIKS